MLIYCRGRVFNLHQIGPVFAFLLYLLQTLLLSLLELCLLVSSHFLEVGRPGLGWSCQFASLLDLLLHQLVTFGEHSLLQFDSDDLAELFGIQADIMMLSIVNLRIVANQVDIAQ